MSLALLAVLAGAFLADLVLADLVFFVCAMCKWWVYVLGSNLLGENITNRQISKQCADLSTEHFYNQATVEIFMNIKFFAQYKFLLVNEICAA